MEQNKIRNIIIAGLIGLAIFFTGLLTGIFTSRSDGERTIQPTDISSELRVEQQRSADTISRIEGIQRETSESLSELRLSMGRQHDLSEQLRAEIGILEDHFNSIYSIIRDYSGNSTVGTP